jgi:hypothetical protein
MCQRDLYAGIPKLPTSLTVLKSAQPLPRKRGVSRIPARLQVGDEVEQFVFVKRIDQTRRHHRKRIDLTTRRCIAIEFVPMERIVDETIRANVEITTTTSGSAKCFCRRCSPFSLRSKISGIVKD